MIEDFTIWLIKLTGKAYTAFIITLAIMAGIGTGLKVMGLQKQRREHYEQEVVEKVYCNEEIEYLRD